MTALFRQPSCRQKHQRCEQMVASVLRNGRNQEYKVYQTDIAEYALVSTKVWSHRPRAFIVLTKLICGQRFCLFLIQSTATEKGNAWMNRRLDQNSFMQEYRSTEGSFVFLVWDTKHRKGKPHSKRMEQKDFGSHRTPPVVGHGTAQQRLFGSTKMLYAMVTDEKKN